MRRALDYEILPGLTPSSVQPAARQPRTLPTMVCTLLVSAQEFEDQGRVLQHNRTVRIEERWHDYAIDRSGKFRYFSHSVGLTQQVDVLVVYETEAIA